MLFYTYSNKNKFERRQKPKFSCYYIFAQSTALMSHHFVTWTSHRSNLCFDFAVLQEHLGPVLKRLMADLLEIEQILHHVRNPQFSVYVENTLLKGNSIHAF